MSVLVVSNAAAAMAAYPAVSNFRDAGGLALISGRMATGRLFRSAAPRQLKAADIEALGTLQIKTIVDLRGRQEADNAPTRGHDGDQISIVATPIEPRTSGKIREALADGTASAALMRDLMIASYRAYVNDSAAVFGDALTALLTSGTPALVHCTAGKDRTGFVIAVIQSALGAHEDAIMTDYLRTNTDWDRSSASSHLPLDSEVIAPVLMADTDYLAAAFGEIARQDGSVHAFIQRATQGRVTARHLDALINAGDTP